jgi:hypothetical protein
MNQNAGLGLKYQIGDAESDQLRDPQSSGKAKMKHCSITNAVSVDWVWGVQDGLHFLSREVSDKAGIGFLCWDGQNAPDLLQSRRHAILHIAHE